MVLPRDIAPRAEFLDAPSDPDLAQLYHLWRNKRGLRLMPSRVDFDPAEFHALLPNVFIVDVRDAFKVRVAGEAIVEFFGRSTQGHPAGTFMRPEGSDALVRLLNLVVESRAPIFRAGQAYWSENNPHMRFEACFLPLSSDDKAVNMILAAVKFA